MKLILTDEEKDEIVNILLERMEEKHGDMLATLKIKLKADQIEDLDEYVGNAVETALDNATIDVDVDAKIRT